MNLYLFTLSKATSYAASAVGVIANSLEEVKKVFIEYAKAEYGEEYHSDYYERYNFKEKDLSKQEFYDSDIDEYSYYVLVNWFPVQNEIPRVVFYVYHDG